VILIGENETVIGLSPVHPLLGFVSKEVRALDYKRQNIILPYLITTLFAVISFQIYALFARSHVEVLGLISTAAFLFVVSVRSFLRKVVIISESKKLYFSVAPPRFWIEQVAMSVGFIFCWIY
jgi:hypothetical protein